MTEAATQQKLILRTVPLGFPWETPDPFLFCVYHLDNYPPGNEGMGPDESLAGRDIGMDFAGKDGWRMYHGSTVPGFPRHPHRGFETVTFTRRGLIDHSDSLGATARFGEGDVQWITTGKGIVHAEMFPLLHRDERNPVDFFQIWLNLPAKNKLVEPHFKMLWGNTIPKVTRQDPEGRETEITIVAGTLEEATPPAPTPDSWAADPANNVAIWTLKMAPGAAWTLPAVGNDINRMLYFFKGESLQVGAQTVKDHAALTLMPGCEVSLKNGETETELLLLQGKPIGEPVAQHGPFVMNTREELMQAYEDYQRTEYGGWPWKTDGHVHAREQGRHARYPDGRTEQGPTE